MSFQFRPAVREQVPLLIGLAGGTGSGKTYSAMRIAKGLSGDRRFAVIDTEAGRAKHYAERFAFDHGDLRPPFRPMTYLEAIEAADAASYPVIVVDSMSHEWAGDGGVLDWQEDEFKRLGGREASRLLSWSAPKQAHKQFVSRLLQVRAHLILCFRAEPKVDMVKNPDTGKMEIIEKAGAGGYRGWLPVCEKTFPYELTVSVLFMAEKPGEPHIMKAPEDIRGLFTPAQPVTEDTGIRLGEWARGGTPVASRPAAPRQSVPAPALPDTDAPPPLWTKQELNAALQAATITVHDLSPILGQPATRENYAELIDTWMFHNPGKRIADLISAAIAHHTSPPAEPQPALLGAE